MSSIFGGETKGQKTARRYTEAGIGQLRGAKEDMLANPLFQRQQSNAQSLADNPISLTPEIVAMIKANLATQGEREGQGAFAAARERHGAYGGFRGGAETGDELRVSQGLGDTFASNNRQVDTQAATQRLTDLMNVLQAIGPVINQRYQFDRDIAGAYTGAASNPVWQQPSPLSGTLGALGGLVGLGLTAPTAGAFGGGSTLGNWLNPNAQANAVAGMPQFNFSPLSGGIQNRGYP